MPTVDDVARSLNTVGLAAWFGGSLMGAVALRGSDSQRPGGAESSAAIQVEDDAWQRWQPVQNVAIAAHLLGAAKMATTNKGRLVSQRGVAKVSVIKTVCTAGALGATFYAAQLGKQARRAVEESGEQAPDGDTQGGGPEPSATIQRLRMVQAAVPLLTGAMLVADSRLGEQQRPMEVLRGMAARAMPDALQSLPDAFQNGPALGGAVSAVSDVAKHLPESVKHLPEGMRHLPEGMKHLPEGMKHLPEAAKHLPDAARSLVSS